MAGRTRRGRRVALPTALAAAALLTMSTPAWAADGTMRVLKGGDRVAGSTDNREYAADLSGALFEYTTDAAKAANPASTGWTAFPAATNASGIATVTVAAGTYYVRERTPSAPDFDAFGAVRALAFDDDDSTPATTAPYVAKLIVQGGQTTEAAPNRNRSADTGQWTDTEPGDAGSPFIDVRDDPPFPASCGINILLVLDRSGSIAGHEDDYRDAAKAFVDSLAGTPTQIGILSFSAGAAPVNSYAGPLGSATLTHAPADLGQAGSADSLDATIDEVYSGPAGGTNWDAALQAAAAAKGFAANPSTGQTGNADVVVFLTDGNPTARSTDGSDAGADVDLLDLTSGMASANLVKSQAARSGTQAKLFAIGVGSGVNASNLSAVSGPAEGEDFDTPTIAQLEAELQELAARTCGARVHVRKRLAGGTTDQAGWEFTGARASGSVSYADDDPRTHATGSGTETAILVGQVAAAGEQLTVTEAATGQPLAAFGLISVSCRRDAYDGPAVTPSASPPLGVTLPVARGDELFCTFTNAPTPEIAIDKRLRRQGGGGEFVDGPITVHVGDTIEYRFTVTNPGPSALAVAFSDARCDAGTLTGPAGDADADGRLDPSETWTYACTHAVTAADPDPLPNTATATGTDEFGQHVSDTDSASADILHPAITIVKSGPAVAYPGDTLTFNFTVRNTGDVTLTGVTVTDDRCAPVTGGQTTLAPGAAATFTCTTRVDPSHAAGDPNPLHNVAITTGKDTLGKVVTATDDHDTTVLHPAIHIEKSGPATATAGQVLRFSLAVTNPGDVAFAADRVVVADPGCDEPPTLTSKGGDATPASLDPGDIWIYACSHATVANVALTYPNTAAVTGTDANGRRVTDDDSIQTVVDAGGTEPQEVVNGTARLRGPSGCVSGAFRATVRGSRIARVTFSVDGRRVERLTAPNGSGGRFTLKVKPAGRGFGVHRVTARVVFAAAARTRGRTLRLSFQRCRKQVVRPRFTG